MSDVGEVPRTDVEKFERALLDGVDAIDLGFPFYFNGASDLIGDIAGLLGDKDVLGRNTSYERRLIALQDKAGQFAELVSELGRVYVRLSVVRKKVFDLLAALDDAGLLKRKKKRIENALNMDNVFSSLGIFMEIAVCFSSLKTYSHASDVLGDNDKLNWYLGVCNLEAKTALAEYDKGSLKWILAAQREYNSIGGGHLVREFCRRTFEVNSDDLDGDSGSDDLDGDSGSNDANDRMSEMSESNLSQSEWSGPGE